MPHVSPLLRDVGTARYRENSWEANMGGLVIDIYVEFLIRVIIRFFKTRGSAAWPIIEAKVTSTGRRGGYGCDVADVNYHYRVEGELYAATDSVPFIFMNSAEQYLEEHSAGSKLLVRIKSGSPECSIVRQNDLYRQAHGYPLPEK